MKVCGPYTAWMSRACDLLGEDVHERIHRQHWTEGRTWKQIARDLTDYGVFVQPETLRRWNHWYRTGR